ncbi:hypothetical protein Tco_0678963 [Tanacetum coccineum]|uniref:Retrovirus-related Pol polyprotein from transposon TNT 1-94-like beta-barrel domain-containing protein n=1 Tax=Tanacetum coccineum TaxID=301880 RepID=A0ABQ4XGJ5_9ASTR
MASEGDGNRRIQGPIDTTFRRAHWQPKARKVSSDEVESCSGSDEEYAMAVRDFKKFFRRRGKFIRQPHDDKKNFWKVKEGKKGKEDRRCFNESDKEDESKKDEICLMALDNNEVLSDTPYHSSSSLDSESLQNEYNKLCKIILRIINKNKHLKAKNELLNNEACALKKKLDQLEKNKEASVKCETCAELRSKVNSLSLKLTRFKSSSYFLHEMIDNQRSLKDKHELGFIEGIASTSQTKTKKLSPVDEEMSTVELAVMVPSAIESASSNIGVRPSSEDSKILESNMVRLKIKLEPDEWIKDSGSYRHMTGNKDLFSTYDAINRGNVMFGSNTKSKIIGKGQICDKKCKVLFSETDSEILKDDITIGRGIRKNSLYIMKMRNSPKDSLCLTSMDDTSKL